LIRNVLEVPPVQATHFDKTLKTFQHRRPFRPFLVRFVSGEAVDVDHPEAVVVRAGVGVYVAPDGTPTLFDHESVSEVVAAPGRRPRGPDRGA
jgi:hypothetical protein